MKNSIQQAEGNFRESIGSQEYEHHVYPLSVTLQGHRCVMVMHCTTTSSTAAATVFDNGSPLVPAQRWRPLCVSSGTAPLSLYAETRLGLVPRHSSLTSSL